jgi:hypothetical protein
MQQNQQLVQTLLECARVCQACAIACLSEEEVKMLSKCIKLDIDCAEICMVGANLLQRDALISDSQLEVCAEICGMCADECEKHAKMKHCKECAEICRRCEEACHTHV